MDEVADFPHGVHEIETAWIPMADGIRLAARLWLPDGSDGAPVPAVLEYLPYRHGDGTALTDSINYPWLAGHGVAGVRVDVRGTGNSEGLITDEYSEAELDDGTAVIAWIAAQPWCNGRVGMWGYSWGGFNALQVAARRPPALKAIMVLHAADDRFTDDCHFMGGCLLDENIEWGNEFLSNSTRPPDPAVVGEAWRAQWHERLEGLTLAAEPWLAHQSRDAYWKRGSVIEDYRAIEAAVYAVGGWADGYSNTVLRLMAGLPGPRKALIGPWGHAWPHRAEPGPQIGFLQEALRWWRHWLAGDDNGIMDEPMVRVWMQESIPPAATVHAWPGRWVAEAAWPSPRPQSRAVALLATGRAQPDGGLALRHPQTVGLTSGKWCPYGLGTDMAGDQRPDDGQSLCFESASLDSDLEILGAPRVTLEFSVDRPRARLALRLGDVAPDGQTARVTYTVRNLCHRDGHESPALLEPGRRYRLSLDLNDVAYAFPAGHRLRLALSTAYWPMLWPSPEPVTLTVFPESLALELPARAPDAALDDSLADFGPAVGAVPLEVERLAQGEQARRFEHDLATGAVTMTMDWGKGAVRFADSGLLFDFRGVVTNTVNEHDPLAARIASRMTQRHGRGDWNVRTEIETELSCTLEAFRLTATVAAWEGDERVFERHWDRTIPRPHL